MQKDTILFTCTIVHLDFSAFKKLFYFQPTPSPLQEGDLWYFLKGQKSGV